MKKHYKFLLMTLFSLVLLGACSSGGNDIPEPTPKPDPDKVTVSPTSLTAEAQGGNLSLNVTANKNWAAASDQGWCKLSKSSGASGTATIPITVEANTTDQERTAKITVTAGTASVTATVKQAKKEPEGGEQGGEQGGDQGGEEGETSNGSSVEDMQNKKW